MRRLCALLFLIVVVSSYHVFRCLFLLFLLVFLLSNIVLFGPFSIAPVSFYAFFLSLSASPLVPCSPYISMSISISLSLTLYLLLRLLSLQMSVSVSRYGAVVCKMKRNSFGVSW